MNEEVFAAKDAYVLSLAASIGAGCLPCAGYYIERGRQAGVGDGALRAAISLAESLRTCAAADCAWRARQRLEDTAGEPSPLPTPASSHELLVSLAVACAVNSHALAIHFLDAARRAAIPDEAVRETVRIARGVRSMAIAIVERRLAQEGLGDEGASLERSGACACG